MAFGLAQYARGRKNLPPTAAVNPLRPNEKAFVLAGFIGALVVLAIVFATGLVNYDNFKNVLFGVVLVVTTIYFARLFITGKQLGAKTNYIIAYIPLFIAACVFWAVWFQVFTAVSIYFETFMNRTVGGFEVPPAWLTSAQGLWVILLASGMAAM